MYSTWHVCMYLLWILVVWYVLYICNTKGKLKNLKIFFSWHNVCFVVRARKNVTCIYAYYMYVLHVHVNILVQKLHFPLQNIHVHVGRKIRKNIFLFLIFLPLEAGDPPASTEPILVKIFYRLPIFRGMFCREKCPFQNQLFFGIKSLECSWSF